MPPSSKELHITKRKTCLTVHFCLMNELRYEAIHFFSQNDLIQKQMNSTCLLYAHSIGF